MSLATQHCGPCEGGTEPLDRAAAEDLLADVKDWHLDEDATAITRELRFQDFQTAIDFVNAVAAIAESEGHHPDILVHGYKNVRLTLSTHAISGLSDNDFILAAKVDRVV